MSFRSRRAMALRPVDSTKNIVDNTGILVAGTNTVISTVIDAVDAPVITTANNVESGCKVNGFYLSLFFQGEHDILANELPVVDFYVYHDAQGQSSSVGFVANGFPTPGGTGVHRNKNNVLHEEKGLVGGGATNSNGTPMVFKGVIVIPKGRRSMSFNDKVVICARSNFDARFCLKAIYKWYK